MEKEERELHEATEILSHGVAKNRCSRTFVYEVRPVGKKEEVVTEPAAAWHGENSRRHDVAMRRVCRCILMLTVTAVAT